MPHVNIIYDKGPRLKMFLSDRMEKTPDAQELRKKGAKIPVFVYGTLKKGFNNHYFYLSKADYLGKARTLKPEFKMLSARNHAYPAIVSGRDFVYGEVYSITVDELFDLDVLESNGSLYQREKIPIKLSDQMVGNDDNDQRNPILYCWAYLPGPSGILVDSCADTITMKVVDNQPVGYHWSSR